VCALHEHEHTRLKALNKFGKYKLIFGKRQIDGSLLSIGCKSLIGKLVKPVSKLQARRQ
jgi:hypothetical protein